MAKLSHAEEARRNRIEGLIAAASPLLNVVLAVGERISRLAEPTDHEYYPVRSGGARPLPGEAGHGEASEPGTEDGPAQRSP